MLDPKILEEVSLSIDTLRDMLQGSAYLRSSARAADEGARIVEAQAQQCEQAGTRPKSETEAARREGWKTQVRADAALVSMEAIRELFERTLPPQVRVVEWGEDGTPSEYAYYFKL